MRLDGSKAAYQPSPGVAAALNDLLGDKPLNRFPDTDAEELRAKLSEYVLLPPDHISCYAGGRIALEHIFRTYLESGTELIVNSPAPPEVRIMAQSTGARVSEIEHPDPFCPGIENIVNGISTRTRAVYIGNPNEYTGSVFSEAELVFLLAYAERTMVVIDEDYFEFSGRSVVDLTARFPNLAVIRSFSKGFGLASLKAGYIVTGPENLQFIHRIKNDSGPDCISQAAARAALDDLNFVREKMVSLNISKKAIAGRLIAMGYEFRMAPANFFLLKVSDSMKATELLEKEGIRVTDLSDIKGLEGYLRITIGTEEQSERLLVLLDGMAGSLSGVREEEPVGGSANRIKTAVDESAAASL
jgi:histidinol-phosphate aminotransferase